MTQGIFLDTYNFLLKVQKFTANADGVRIPIPPRTRRAQLYIEPSFRASVVHDLENFI